MQNVQLGRERREITDDCWEADSNVDPEAEVGEVGESGGEVNFAVGVPDEHASKVEFLDDVHAEAHADCAVGARLENECAVGDLLGIRMWSEFTKRTFPGRTVDG